MFKWWNFKRFAALFLMASGIFAVNAQGLSLLDELNAEVESNKPSILEKGFVAPKPTKPAVKDNRVSPKASPAVRIVERPVVVTNTVEKVKIVEKPVERLKIVTNFVERVVQKPVERVKVVTNVVEKIVKQSAAPVERVKVVTKVVTNEVEKVVVDSKHEQEIEKRLNQRIRALEQLNRAHSEQLNKVKKDFEKLNGLLEVENSTLSEQNEELRRQIKELTERNEKLERVAAPATLKQLSGRPAKITADSTYYDRKDGVVLFDNNVYVDDERYQLHADKAYVFFEGTNDLKRIVAVGGVAMTNEMRRAYGKKVSYYRKDGLVVLYGDNEHPAEVRDESKVQDQSVKGTKIRFWIDREQVEVTGAVITAPTEGIDRGDLKRLR